jgi:hypothetical protein
VYLAVSPYPSQNQQQEVTIKKLEVEIREAKSGNNKK